MIPVNDNLFRALDTGIETRAADSGTTMFGHFAVFDTPTTIDSWVEGRFIERLAPGAFRKTIREQRNAIVCSFDHGYDLEIGDKPLGPIEVLREDEVGVYYEVPLLDTSYNRDFILPALEGRTLSGDKAGSVLGASFRFRAVKDRWVRAPGKSDANPEGLPERTITEARLYEFGPVVYPAYAAATASVRSLTDHYTERALVRSGRLQRAVERLGQLTDDPAADGTGEPNPAGPPEGTHDGIHLSLARAQVARLKL